ncbi:MAG TPA: YafY family protein [Steroidobacteraceae bacterium]|jgi:predicted DNA-binding transcriptional regulator YafY|nr:YafY family protein [Steroidobacteraceae bacterium]
MLKTSARLLRLLSVLQSRQHWPGGELRERVGVDARTIRRDIGRLRELGYAVAASPGLGGGYRLKPGSLLPPVLLDDDEAVAVAVAIRAAAGSVARMDETAIGLLAKLDQLLPARLRKRASALHSVTVSLASTHALPSIEVLTRIASACRDRLKLRLSYRDRAGNTTARTVEPLRLAHTGRLWYLVAWDAQRADWRTFRMDRIQRLMSSGPHFAPREFPGDVGEFVARSMRQVAYRYRVQLRLEGSAAELVKRIPGWCGVLEALDDAHCTLTTGADSIEVLAAQLVMLGTDFEIIGAPDLAPELRRIAARLERATR